MRRAIGILLWGGAAALADGAMARAEVTESSEHGFSIRHSFQTPATPQQAWDAIVTPAAWWSVDHSYSGSGASFSLEARAGGCFCEVWDGGSVKHAEVVQVRNGTLLRLAGGLGPLQGLAVGQVHDWTIEPSGDGAAVSYVTRVSGAPQDGLIELAPVVDGVMAEQLGRLERYLATGSPEE